MSKETTLSQKITEGVTSRGIPDEFRETSNIWCFVPERNRRSPKYLEIEEVIKTKKFRL